VTCATSTEPGPKPTDPVQAAVVIRLPDPAVPADVSRAYTEATFDPGTGDTATNVVMHAELRGLLVTVFS
jgi:hypothetical protein